MEPLHSNRIAVNPVYFIRIVLSFLVLLSLINPYVRSEKLVAASDVWSPFFLIDSKKQYYGIGVDLANEVGQRTGDEIKIMFVPTQRALLMFDKNQVDLMLLDSPLWSNPQKKDNYVFSDIILTVQEYIYFHKSGFIDVKHPSDLAGKTVDVMRGYYYSVFENAFNKQIVKRYEVDSESALILKLMARRTDAIFMDSIAFNYTVSRLHLKKDLFKRGMQLSNAGLGYKVRKEKAYILKRFNHAIESMKNDGTVSRIVQKYLN